jgi:hypothetical protein
MTTIPDPTPAPSAPPGTQPLTFADTLAQIIGGGIAAMAAYAASKGFVSGPLAAAISGSSTAFGMQIASHVLALFKKK